MGILAPAFSPPLAVVLNRTKAAARTYANLWEEWSTLVIRRNKAQRTIAYRVADFAFQVGMGASFWFFFQNLIAALFAVVAMFVGMGLRAALAPQGPSIQALELRIVGARHAFNALAFALDAALATLEPA